MPHSQFTYELQRSEMQRKRNTKQLSETNHLFIFLVSLSYVFAPMEILSKLVGKYGSFLNVVSV